MTALQGTDWSRYDDCHVCDGAATQQCLDMRRKPTATEHNGQSPLRNPHPGRPRLDPDNTVFCPHCNNPRVPISSVTTRSVIHYRDGALGRCYGSDRTREELS